MAQRPESGALADRDGERLGNPNDCEQVLGSPIHGAFFERRRDRPRTMASAVVRNEVAVTCHGEGDPSPSVPSLESLPLCPRPETI
jgi:hypothetical protein